MKYRWSNHVMTRNSGCLTIYCKDRKQAEGNVELLIEAKKNRASDIGFESLSNLSNIMKIDEIIAITCCDAEMMLDVHKEELLEHKALEREIMLMNDNGED